MNKNEILTTALAHREAEVFQHQININNYTLAIAEIDTNYADDAAMLEFRVRLADLLASSIIEQRKEIIMRDVMAKQLES
jgi:cytochrome c551/c552